MRVVLRAAFDPFSGYGRDAIDIAVALDRAGVDVVPAPTSISPGLPMSFARLLTNDPLRRADVALAFTWPSAVDVAELRSMAPKAAVWTMWERTPFRTEDLPRHVRRRLPVEWSAQGLDALAVTHAGDVDAFGSWDPGLADRTTVIPCGIDEAWPVLDRRVDRPVTFLASGKLGTPRKNVQALFETWRDTKAANPGWDARLIVHGIGAGIHPADADAYGPDVVVDQRLLPSDELVDLYAAADVLVSTSCGEGNDKPAMEFLATGGPVMLTDWSAHTSYLHPSVGWPLPGEVTRRPQREGADVFDFEVDRAALSAALLSVTRADVVTRGRAAASWIRASHGWDRVGRAAADWPQRL